MANMTDKPKLLAIGPTPPPYTGMSVVMENLLGSSLRESFELIILDTTDRRGLANVGKLEIGNVVLALRHGVKFLGLLLDRQPDVVYVCISQNTFGYLRDCLFLGTAKLLRRKVVVHLHGGGFRSFYDGASRPLRWLIQWTLRDARRALVLGDSLRVMFAGLVDEARITTVPNGIVDAAVSVSHAGADDKSDLQVTYLGNLIRSKGFLDFIRAVPLVLARYPHVRFVVAGAPALDSDLNEANGLIDAFAIASKVEMPGAVVGPKKWELLAQSDIFAFPTYYPPEGQPLVILEAMAAGLPVITCDQGAIRETVIDGVTGFIVPAQNPAKIAEKIIALCTDVDLRVTMGQSGRERFSKNYILDRWVADLARVFREVAEEQKK
jgi:glycosyltransferase involved in cell wall biosynthesis